MAKSEGTTAQKFASPAKIQQFLKGAHYPSNKQELVNLAKKNKAPNNVMYILDSIPEKEYNSPIHVMKEVGKME